MSIYNDLSVEIYSSGTTLIKDPAQEIRLAQDISFTTQYPGGLSGKASFFVPHKVTAWWEVCGGQRVLIRNKQRAVWEGYIANLESVHGPGGQGVNIDCLGAWGHVLMNWQLNKPWCDTRIDDSVWKWQVDETVYTGCEKCTVERTERIRFIPKAEAWVSGEFAAVRYTMPIGQTVKRLKYSWVFKEGGASNDWEMSAWRTNDPAGGWTAIDTFAISGDVYTTGTTTVIVDDAAPTGDIDVALATASRYIEFRYYARDNQTPTSDGNYYGNFKSIEVYSETGNIYADEIAKDIVTYCTDLNTATNFIAAAGTPLSLVPYITTGYMTLAEILAEVAGKGDGLYNRWGTYTVNSERAVAPDGKPLLVLGAYPVLTDYEYAVSLEDVNLAGGVSISQDTDDIANDMIVGFTDPNGIQVWRTSDDLATLKDATSIAKYGKHTVELNIGVSISGIADSIGLRYLAQYKDPQYHLNGPIAVMGYIRGKAGNIIPASEVRAQKRVRIENYLNDVTGSGQGLTFVVTQTGYDADSEICSLTTGVPQAPMLLPYFPKVYSSDRSRGGAGSAYYRHGRTPTAATTSGGGGSGRTISDDQLAAWGITRQEWWKIKGTPEGKALRATLKKTKKKG